MALCEGRLRKGKMAAIYGFGGKLSPRYLHDARHFSSSLYATDALQGASVVLREQVLVRECVEPSKRKCLRILQFLSLTQPPLVFTARNYEDVSSWHWSPGLGGLVWGWDPLLPRYPSTLFLPYVGLGPACSTSPCAHPSTPPTHLDECGFFNSLLSDFHTA